MIGLLDTRISPVELEYVSAPTQPAKVAEMDRFTIWSVKWSVLGGIEAEGLLLEPKGSLLARVVALPDADQIPEVITGLTNDLSPRLQFARRLAENGCQVLIPTLANRRDDFSGSFRLNRFTNQPHREWIYRQAFVLGRHIVGYEVQKVMAAIDWFIQQNRTNAAPIGICGWGEGGLLALHSAAADPRIQAALVSGYFGPRERVCDEPIYRNLFGQLNEFGDAEIAQLIVPRALVVEHSRAPEIQGPPHPVRDIFWNDYIGRFPKDTVPMNARSRFLLERPKFRAYEVLLDALPDVTAWGYFLLPKDLKPGEKRPAVVAQHGLMGTSADLLNDDRTTKTYSTYKAFGAALAERGFIVFVPHIPTRSGIRSKDMHRKATPLGKTIYSFFAAQEDRILDWLAMQPNVDANRFGFYGISYGGKTAMRMGALLERYKAVVCSGDFNEMAWKNASIDWWRTFMYTGDYEMAEFRQGVTIGYAEMAAMICPRPFMVERGHNDMVGWDEWVAFEYAKVSRLYNKLRIPHLTEIEYFDGPHTIHGVGGYKFLHRHLGWPEPPNL